MSHDVERANPSERPKKHFCRLYTLAHSSGGRSKLSGDPANESSEDEKAACTADSRERASERSENRHPLKGSDGEGSTEKRKPVSCGVGAAVGAAVGGVGAGVGTGVGAGAGVVGAACAAELQRDRVVLARSCQFLAKFRQKIARFRLHRRRSLQANMRFAAFFKIYQIIQLIF